MRIGRVGSVWVLVLATFRAGATTAAEWGTIAFSPSTHATGWSYNKVNEVDGELAALNACDRYASDCITAINFHDACGALAIGSNGGWGAAWGYDDADAQFKALDICTVNDEGCEVVRWQCSW